MRNEYAITNMPRCLPHLPALQHVHIDLHVYRHVYTHALGHVYSRGMCTAVCAASRMLLDKLLNAHVEDVHCDVCEDMHCCALK